MKRILSIDGGGVRGIIPAILLAELERQTGRPARESFDFVAGTSTGAALTAGIAAGISGEKLVHLYEVRSPEVFRSIPLLSGIRRLLTGTLYDTGTLHELIREELGPGARDWTLNDAPIDLLITAKRVADGMPWYFVKDNPANSCRAGGFRLSHVVTASGAAPTYFRPWRIVPIGELIDGGTGVAGNPVYQACVEAFEYTDAYRPDDTVVVSLGTGKLLGRERPGWLWPWVGWLLAELLRSPAEQQTELVHRHYPRAAFYRLDLELQREIGLDAVGRIGELKALGQKLAAGVDWAAILDARDERYRVTDATTLPREYCRLGPA